MSAHLTFAETGRARSLNRHKFARAALESSLGDPVEQARQVFDGYRHMLRVRRAEPAFHPAGGQRVLDLGPAEILAGPIELEPDHVALAPDERAVCSELGRGSHEAELRDDCRPVAARRRGLGACGRTHLGRSRGCGGRRAACTECFDRADRAGARRRGGGKTASLRVPGRSRRSRPPGRWGPPS